VCVCVGQGDIDIAAKAFKSLHGREKKHFTTITYSLTKTVGSLRSVGFNRGPNSYSKSPFDALKRREREEERKFVFEKEQQK
jgi:hypothetical protein